MLKDLKNLLSQTRDIFSRFRKIICIGEVVEVNSKQQAKVCLKNQGDLITDWLPILSSRALEVSFIKSLAIGEQVVCIFAPIGDMAKGYILGATYNNIDKPYIEDKNIIGIKAKDGTLIEHNQETSVCKVAIANGTFFEISPNGIVINGNVTINGNLNAKEVSDSKSSMQELRDNFKIHIHQAPTGPTGPPEQTP